tara:strand:+ start:33904 stop:34068 length:165 start_codon:yes stop_codon:yes gene_type:complete
MPKIKPLHAIGSSHSLNAGFYLDEWATRITLRLWPVTLPTMSDKYLKQSAAKTL